MTEEAHDTESTPEQIEQAKSQGWRDDPEHPKYKSAAQFLDDGAQIATIGAERNKQLIEKIDNMEKSQAKFAQQVREDLFKERNAGKVAGYEKAKLELSNRKQAAFENDDVDELRVIDKEERGLKTPELETPEPVQEVNVDFVQWQSKNKWYNDRANPDNAAMTVYADSIAPEVGALNLSLEASYEEIGRRTKERFAVGKTETPPAGVELDGHKPPKRNSGKQDWKSLPKDVKEQATNDGYVQRYFAGDKEAYAKSYFTQFGA